MTSPTDEEWRRLFGLPQEEDMQRFRVQIRIKGADGGDEAIESVQTVLAADAIAAIKPFRDAALKMAPKGDKPSDGD